MPDLAFRYALGKTEAMNARIFDWIKNSGVHGWIWLSIATAFLGVFFAVSSEVREASQGQPELIAEIDRLTISAAIGLRSPTLNGMAVDFTALGSASVLTVLIVLASIVFVFQNKRAHALHLIAAALGAAPLSAVGKSFFERARPSDLMRLVEVQGYSYPSGHSLAGAAVYFTTAILLCREVKSQTQRGIILSCFSLLIILIGFSRVYLGVHYFSDIMAGTLLGVAWAALIGAVSAFLEKGRLRVKS